MDSPTSPSNTAPQDASRRTMLAAERTMLAWLRTGIAVGALAIAVGGVLPELRDEQTRWPYVLLGIAYAALGCGVIAYGLSRARKVEVAIAAGEWAPLSTRAFWVLGVSSGGLVALSALLFAVT